MAMEVARARSDGLGRAGLPASIPRRVSGITALTLATIVLSTSSPVFCQKRREAILRLRDDVSTAIAHTSLNEKQTQKLDRCRETLLLAAQSGRARHTVPVRDLHGALKDIEKTIRSGRFQPDDRTVVQQDINQVRWLEQYRRTQRQRVAAYPGI